MKKSVLIMALLAVAATAGAQRNDLYSSGKNSGKSSASSTQATTTTTTVTRTPVATQTVDPVVQAYTTPSIIIDRDPDEYNRRYSYGTSQIQYEDGTYIDDVPTIYIHDTIYVATMLGEDRKTYSEGYMDAVEDYYLTRRLYRFRHYGRPYYSLYDDILWNVIYWDRYFDDRYWYYSHTYYYDPWYYDPWYYDPWYYDSWYYNSWYYDSWYYSSWYAPYPHSVPGGGPHHADRFVPNRKINAGGWDRNLSRKNSDRVAALGSSTNRSVNTTPERTVASRAGERTTTAAATTASRSVQTSGSTNRSVTQSSGTTSRSVSNAGSSSSRSVNSSSSACFSIRRARAKSGLPPSGGRTGSSGFGRAETSAPDARRYTSPAYA